MSLPELEWQFVYGRLAWAVVLASLVAALLPNGWRRARSVVGALLIGAAVLVALPGELSPAYWLQLAFQLPSALLVGLCLLRLIQSTAVVQPMPVRLAVLLALAGSALYLDATGVLPLGLYYFGFSAVGAPLAALALAVACSVGFLRGWARPQALVLLGAVSTFSILRLPTGNLWDALLDPLLWGWAVCALVTHRWRTVSAARSTRQAPTAQPATVAASIRTNPIEHS